MICHQCRAENPESAVYCASCGQPLFRKPRKPRTIIPRYVFVAGLGALLLGAYFIIMIISSSLHKETSPPVDNLREAVSQSVSPETIKLPSVIGRVAVHDLEGSVISGLNSSLFGGIWVAAPVWALLGGENLAFKLAESDAIPVREGLWASGDPILLLKLQNVPLVKTPRLFPWKQYEALHWRPYLEKDSGFQIEIPASEKRGSFLNFPLPDKITESGVFMQDDHIVGWAFPDWLDKGYLWLGSAGTDLNPNVQMDRILHSVLPSYREAVFENILKRGMNIPSARKLEALAQGLSMTSPFSELDVPRHLRLSSIASHMHSLASELVKTGSAAEVALILDNHVIEETQSLALLQDSVLARLKNEDYNKAIQFLESIKKVIKGQEIAEMDQFHAKLYKDWLRKILDQGSYFSGMVAFEQARHHFPEDIELHLLGVEMAIKEKNWTRARNLLQMRDYPETMRGWVGELENEIQEVQENEGAVTIRFNPGAKHIPVRVYINRTHSFRFILDTGATMCSIPSSALDRLRIDIDQTTPVRLVSTAGGIAEVYEVRLNSIELEGLRIFNVDALVIDIPGYRDYGLLGQNFLNSFHIEIDNQMGILRLRKR
jgi:clan AA aspartic protease (TIGR02281 family)